MFSSLAFIMGIIFLVIWRVSMCCYLLSDLAVSCAHDSSATALSVFIALSCFGQNFSSFFTIFFVKILSSLHHKKIYVITPSSLFLHQSRFITLHHCIAKPTPPPSWKHFTLWYLQYCWWGGGNNRSMVFKPETQLPQIEFSSFHWRIFRQSLDNYHEIIDEFPDFLSSFIRIAVWPKLQKTPR